VLTTRVASLAKIKGPQETLASMLLMFKMTGYQLMPKNPVLERELGQKEGKQFFSSFSSFGTLMCLKTYHGKF